MPAKPRTDAERLAIVALARIDGPTEAAAAGNVPERTVRRWLAAEEGRDRSTQEWQAAHDFAMAKHLRAALADDPVLAYSWMKPAMRAASVSNRIAMHAAKAEPTPDPEQAAAEAATAERLAAFRALPSHAHRRMLVAALRVSLYEQTDGPAEPSADGGQAAMLQLLERVGQAPADEVAARIVTLRERIQAIVPSWALRPPPPLVREEPPGAAEPPATAPEPRNVPDDLPEAWLPYLR